MEQKTLRENGITLGSGDVTATDGIKINPPPNEPHFFCCGRPQSELTPFVEGVFLGKKYRRDAPQNKVVQIIYDEFFENCNTDEEYLKAKEKLVHKYGEKKAENIIGWVSLSNIVGSHGECVDCICLDDYAFKERYLDSLDPPEKCDCCSRNLGELSPFTEDDPVMNHFNGKLLARRYRIGAPPTEGVNKMADELFGNCITVQDLIKSQKKIIQEYGMEEGYKLWTFTFFLDDLFKHSWECRDCIILDTKQYFKKIMAQE
jgi:hypothetical protein